jgi:hypothetical protein
MAVSRDGGRLAACEPASIGDAQQEETAMTTQATTTRESKSGVRSLLAATAFTAVALAGAAFWLVRPDGQEGTAPATHSATTATSEGAIPMGGLAERYRDEQQAREATDVTSRGGLAELYAEQQAAGGATAATARDDCSAIVGSADC